MTFSLPAADIGHGSAPVLFRSRPNQAPYFMMAVDMQKELARHLRSEDVPNIEQLAVTLKRCGFSNGIVLKQRGWYVMRQG